MDCIFCKKNHESKSIEHIVSESLGNDFYVMPINSVCDGCNQKFSKFEQKALSNTVFLMERANLGIVTKKGRNVKGKIENLEIQGHPNFKAKHVFINGIYKENIVSYNKETNEIKLLIKSFDKSEEAAAKLVLKISLESFYKSRKKDIYDKYNFDDLREYVLGISNKQWPFILSDYEPNKFTSVPQFYDKYRLKKRKILLEYLMLNDKTLLFRFNFNGIKMIINTLNRNSEWIKEFQINDSKIQINPEKYKNQLQTE